MLSSFKPSVLTAAVLLASASMAQAQDFVITDTEYNTDFYAGIYLPKSDFSEDVVVTTGELPDGHQKIYGTQINDHKITFHGNLTIDANATTTGALAYGLRSQSNAEVIVLGDTKIHASTLAPIPEKNASQGNAVGVLAEGGGSIDLSAGKTEITIDVGSSRPYGFQIVGGSVTTGKTLVTMNLHEASNPDNSGSDWVHAIYAAGGTYTAEDDTTFVVNGADSEGNLIDLGNRVIRVVNLEGSAYNTNAQFDKNLNIVVNANANAVRGVYVSGDTKSTTDLHAGINIDGLLGIDIQGAFDSAYGIYAQGESRISTNQANISIQSTKINGTVYGIYSTANPESYPGPGYVNVENGLTVNVQGQGQTVGILSLGTYDNRTSMVNVGGASYINVVSEEGAAIGVAVQEGATSTLHNVVADVRSLADEGEAIGLDLSSADVTLTGHHTINVDGSSAVGINAFYTDLDINGSAVVTSDTALISDQDSVINVTGEDQTGHFVLNGNVSNEGTLNLDNATMSVNDTTKEALLGIINTAGNNESTVELSAGTYAIESFNGKNKTLLLNDLANTQSVTIAHKTGDLRIAASARSNDQYANAQATAQALKETVVITEDETQAQNNLDVQAGDVNDALTAQLNRDGSLSDVRIVKNDKLDAFGSVAALSALSLRHEMNSLSKRMGELRDAPAGTGLWVRAYGSEMEYGDQNVTMKSNSIQIGADRSIGDWRVGAAFTYTDGDTTYDLGAADTKGYGFSLYGTWFVPCGAYVDLMAKYNRLDNDFGLNGMNGSYDSNAFGASVETGYRFEFMQGGLYLEPQVGLNYGRIGGETINTSNGVTIDQDSYNSLIGRAGIRAGFKFPENKGTIYARVSGLYDFDGEVNGTASKGVAHNTIEEDMGGAWIEMGVGANFNWTDNTYTYVDFERTNGGDVKENYRWNVGVRHTF